MTLPVSRSLPWHHTTYDVGVTISVRTAGPTVHPSSLKTIPSKQSRLSPAPGKPLAPESAGIGMMLAPQDDEILLLQIVLIEGQRAAPLPKLNRAAVCVTAHAAPRDRPQKVSRIRRARAFRRLSARGDASDDNPYGYTTFSGNDMQGERCKLFDLPVGGGLLYSRLRSVTMTELNTACFGREEWPSSSQSVLRPFNWEEKNAVSMLSFRLSSKESFGRRSYCCTLGDHRRAVGGRSRANAESQPYLWGPSPSRWGRPSTLSAPDGARASQATRRVAYAEEATLTLLWIVE